MKNQFIVSILLLMLFPLFVFGQKQTKKRSRFVCDSDSLNYYQVKNLADNGIRQIMTFHYEYDNGRVENSVHYIIWIEGEKGYLKEIRGLHKPFVSDDININEINKIFDYYSTYRIDTINAELEPERWQSHDMGYYITVYLPGKNKYYNIRNYKREEPIPEDPRIKWIDLFEQTIKKIELSTPAHKKR